MNLYKKLMYEDAVYQRFPFEQKSTKAEQKPLTAGTDAIPENKESAVVEVAAAAPVASGIYIFLKTSIILQNKVSYFENSPNRVVPDMRPFLISGIRPEPDIRLNC